MGPTLGGYLTETYNWRYVFYVNLPFGILAIIGLLIFLPKATPRHELSFDWSGFAVLAMGIGALQLMLDRGQNLDWFPRARSSSRPCWPAWGSICSSCICSPPNTVPAARRVQRPQFRCGMLDGVLRIAR